MGIEAKPENVFIEKQAEQENVYKVLGGGANIDMTKAAHECSAVSQRGKLRRHGRFYNNYCISLFSWDKWTW